MKKKNKNMTAINKSAKKNPLEDKKWLKNFAEGLKKDINKSGKQKNSPGGWVGEINCTQEDIGKPNYPYRKKRSNLTMPRTLSKKMKQNVSWNQRGRNKKLKSKLKELDQQRGIFYKLTKI